MIVYGHNDVFWLVLFSGNVSISIFISIYRIAIATIYVALFEVIYIFCTSAQRSTWP